MPVIEVAAGIPCPQTSSVTPEERRLLSDGDYGPRGARTIELDERQFQTLTWALSVDQAAAFRIWYRDTLIYGGAWFSAPATWPTPEGVVVKVRRFLGGPQWTYRGNGHWLLAINAEVRGETLLPSEPAGGGIGWHEPVQDSGGELTASPDNEGTLTSAFFGGTLYGGIWPWVGGETDVVFAVSSWEPVIPDGPPPSISYPGDGTFQISPGVDSFEVVYGVASITATRNGQPIPNRLQVTYSDVPEEPEVYANVEYLWFSS